MFLLVLLLFGKLRNCCSESVAVRVMAACRCHDSSGVTSYRACAPPWSLHMYTNLSISIDE